MAVYTRRELANKTGFGFDALRYYEERGLMPRPDRSEGNYRQYGEDAVERLLFIKQAKLCGFSLKEIARTLSLIEGEGDCEVAADEVIDGKIEEIDERVAELEKMKRMLISAKASLKDMGCVKLNAYLDLAPYSKE